MRVDYDVFWILRVVSEMAARLVAMLGSQGVVCKCDLLLNVWEKLHELEGSSSLSEGPEGTFVFVERGIVLMLMMPEKVKNTTGGIRL